MYVQLNRFLVSKYFHSKISLQVYKSLASKQQTHFQSSLLSLRKIASLQLLLSSVSHWQFIIIKEWFFTAICLKGYCQTSVLFPSINLLSLGPTRQGCFMPFQKTGRIMKTLEVAVCVQLFYRPFASKKGRHFQHTVDCLCLPWWVH